MEGYFKVYRKITESSIFAHPVALKIWIWCLAKASYKDRFATLKVGRGETIVSIKAGQFLFGRFKAEEELGIDGSTIYKWINRFASAEFDMITIESNNQYSVITICNWVDYQEVESEEVTSKEQPSNNEVAAKEQLCNTNKKDKKVNKDKKVFIIPSIEEIKDYFVLKNIEDKDLDYFAERFYNFYSSKNWFVGKNKMAEWKAAATNSLKWEDKRAIQPKNNGYVKHRDVPSESPGRSGSSTL